MYGPFNKFTSLTTWIEYIEVKKRKWKVKVWNEIFCIHNHHHYHHQHKLLSPLSDVGGGGAKTCWDGPDKMPTKKLVRTKCQPWKKSPGQNANLGWHFVRLAFCPVGILSYHQGDLRKKSTSEIEIFCQVVGRLFVLEFKPSSASTSPPWPWRSSME